MGLMMLEGTNFKAIIQANQEERAREIAASMEGPLLSYQIIPRAPELGGGFRLRLLEGEEEMGGGGVFPAGTPREVKQAMEDAKGEGDAWVERRPRIEE